MPTYKQSTSVEDAIRLIQSGNRVFIHGSAATPTYLLQELANQSTRLNNVELVSISLHGEFLLANDEFRNSFKVNSLFASEPVRLAINEGRADYIPIFLSEIPDLFRSGFFPLDVALVHVSPPDSHGYCSLGTSVDVARAAVNNARIVIAQVNSHMPRTHGDGMIHVNRFDAMVFHDSDLPETSYASRFTDADHKIGCLIAELIEDGSTLQLGIGAIPDAVMSCLGNHKDLGIHTEMFSDGIIDLINNGVITNKYKVKHPGYTVTTFCIGTKRLYGFINDNPSIIFLDTDYVNETGVIRQNPKVVAINSCIEIDLTGQVCADSIGTYQYSGVGGQMDFMRGAALSKGGKPIIAVRSRTAKGQSRIVSFLKQGASVVTTRAHVHYVVTEFGIAYLFGKNLRQRASELIRIAHPDDKEYLERMAFERFRVHAD